MMAPLLPLTILGCSMPRSGLVMPHGHYRYWGLTSAPMPPHGFREADNSQPLHPDYEATGSAVLSRGLATDARPMTALHATLPVPSLVEITNLDNECSIIVRIVGRGADSHDRVIEVSPAAAKLLRIRWRGDVQVKYLKTANFGDDDVIEQTHIARYPGLGCKH
jgi:rare lipoprotein A